MTEFSGQNGGTAVIDPDNAAGKQTQTETKPPFVEKIRAWRRRMPLAVRLPLALVFLMIGVIGGFIPILQGWMFILAALWLLFPDHAEQIVEKIKAWLQKFRRKS
jgi:hypothetical protein